jgi:hypothetical protein
MILLPPAANAQVPVSLQEQLDEQYKVAKLGSKSGDMPLLETGTLLVVQKEGVLSTPPDTLGCEARFQDNTLHRSGRFCINIVQSTGTPARYFQTGEKVYPMKVSVDLRKEKITFMVVACDACNGTAPPTSMRGEVIFQFPKGYLERTSAAEVEDTIGQVFSVVSEEEQRQSGQQAEGGQDQEQSEPKTVQLGMTIDQVQDVLGKPNKIFNLGAKQIYVYNDVKVTFLNGKVSDVQ